MSEMHEHIDALVKFRDQRDWAQSHDSKNLAVAISSEAWELTNYSCGRPANRVKK